jgi:hypothetical protein
VHKLPGLGVHFSEAQQGKVFEKITKQYSRGWLRGTEGTKIVMGFEFYMEIFSLVPANVRRVVLDLCFVCCPKKFPEIACRRDRREHLSAARQN